MSIKSDKWIRRMAQETGMIEPFVAGQIRNGEAGKVISYGTSSYGYDVRCANEFKIFTNINSVIVDPKNFDPNSFVDVQSDVCIIPPNSFALARTVEYFKIPRNVLVVCLGKSSYARCFRADTRVALLDGTAPTLEEMAKRAENGEVFWGYSIVCGHIIASLLTAPRYIGRDKLIELILDSGESIFCTPDHEFINRDGCMVQAGNLRVGASLMPLYRSIQRGYEMIYQISNNRIYPTHRLAAEWTLRHGIYAEEIATHKLHIDGQRCNNYPWNTRMNADEYSHYHNSQMYAESFNTQTHAEAVKLAEIAKCINYRTDIAADSQALDATGSIRGTATRRNHKIAEIRTVAGEHDVYCLTAPEAGNFALEAGVFVANCGIIVNVTPLEPCFSSDTEILTKNGWKYFNEIVIGSEVLTMNPETQQAEWQAVDRIQAYTYRGDLLHFNSRGIDLLVTPDHSLYVDKFNTETHDWQGWHKNKAAAVFGQKYYRMSRAVQWQGDDIADDFMIENEPYNTNSLLTLIGLYLSAGCCTYNHLINITALSDKDKTQVTDILNALQQPAKYTGTAWQFENTVLYNLMQSLGKSHDKTIPQWLKNLPAYRLQYLLNGLKLGEAKTFTYNTVSERLADDIQELLFKIGAAATICDTNIAEIKKQVNGHELIEQYTLFKIRQSSIITDLKLAPELQKKVAYTGMVYDVTVPNHIIFVRRNGKAIWSGNCWEGHVTLEFSNTTPLPAKIYANEGVAQLLFFGGDEECETSYKDREGKYQGQTGITLPKA